MSYEAQPQHMRSLALEERTYLRLLADVDMTKHLGGLDATQELLELTHVDGAAELLDVGCGVGLTAAYIAKHYPCRVVGVDVFDRMVERCRERAQREKVEDRTEFRVADARELPFEDGRFDTVICESVLVMIEEQDKALREFVRVVKPGGYVGISEATWLREPTEEAIDYVNRSFGGAAGYARDQKGWEQLMVEAGLSDVRGEVRRVTAGSESRANIKTLGWRNMLRLWYRFFVIARSSPEYRNLLKEALSTPGFAFQFWGCGLFVGRR